MLKTGRNDPCPCGSGQKYKKCCATGGGSFSKGNLQDDAWIRVRQLEGNTINRLMEWALKTFSPLLMREALITLLGDIDLPETALDSVREQMFAPWFLFHWKPISTALLEETIAAHYLAQHAADLNSRERQFLERMCRSYYSYYVVLEVIPEQALIVEDILLETQHRLKERSGTRCLKRGDVIYACILTMEDQSIFIGMAPLPLHLEAHLDLLQERKMLQEDCGGTLTGEWLRSQAASLRALYFDMVEARYHAPPPVFCNTDGDWLEPCTVSFTIHVLPEEALYRLMPLTLSKDLERWLNTAERYKNGNLKKVTFCWIKRGNKQHKDWDHTIMGHITITQGKVVASVNSQKRAKKIEQLIKKYLAEDAIYLKTTIQSQKSLMAAVRKKPISCALRKIA